MNQKELSRWLRVVVVIGWIACALLSVLVMPKLAADTVLMYPEFKHLARPCMVLFWIGMLPVILALWHAWMIFGAIGRDNSFCRDNARRLRIISVLAMTDTILCVAAILALLALGALHPGVFLLLLLITVIGAGIAVAAAALSHLTLKAAVLQDENDLTI